ncbi:Hypothetical predicted protein [Marmota monax]|uniref:Uncharacterized protein n=1 Tax=Marmota monax TaxID=9995 RepID=A0A5E4C5F2_MARMO|nr:Hypothetical predicted protein [Marmota monax]
MAAKSPIGHTATGCNHSFFPLLPGSGLPAPPPRAPPPPAAVRIHPASAALARGSEQGRVPQPAPQGRTSGPSCGSPGGRTCRRHGGAAGQAGPWAWAAGAVHAWLLPNAANAPLPTQLLLHQGHRLLCGL